MEGGGGTAEGVGVVGGGGWLRRKESRGFVKEK